MFFITDSLKQLCLLDGVSGDEKAVRNFIISEIKDFCEFKVDNLGNLICFKKGEKTPNKKIMLDAHMDEVGFIITNITNDGFLKFATVGGIDTAALLSRRVRINGNIAGVIGCKPIHLLEADSRKKLPKLSELCVDIGASNKEAAAAKVSLGDCGIIYSDFEILGNSIKAKALDDRIGCSILIKLLKEYNEYDFYAVFSTQEEVGLRGAKVSSYSISPDFCLVLEATTAADIAGSTPDSQVCVQGEGPAISFMDKATVYDRALYTAALNSGIKCQPKTAVSGGNNAGSIHLSGAGIRTLAISAPCRYIHTSNSIVNLNDIENMYKLTEYMLKNIASGNIE